jgi:hypothetical protein
MCVETSLAVCTAWQAQPIESRRAGTDGGSKPMTARFAGPSRATWRGGEGSITDRVTEDMQDSETHELRWSAYTGP